MKTNIITTFLTLIVVSMFCISVHSQNSNCIDNNHKTSYVSLTNKHEHIYGCQCNVSNILNIINNPKQHKSNHIAFQIITLDLMNEIEGIDVEVATQAVHNCIMQYTNDFHVLAAAANLFVNSNIDKEYGIALLKRIVSDSELSSNYKVPAAIRLLNLDIPVGYDLLIERLNNPDKRIRYTAGELLYSFNKYVQRRHKEKKAENSDEDVVLYTINGEKIDLPKVISELKYDLQHTYVTNGIPGL